MLNFDFIEKVPRIIYQQHFVYDSSRKMFLMLYSINWPNFISWLSLLLAILANMCIAFVCFPGREINFIFLIKPFSSMTKTSREQFKYPDNKKSFKGETKRLLIIFKWLSIAKNCLWLESAPLIWTFFWMKIVNGFKLNLLIIFEKSCIVDVLNLR